LLHVSFGNRLLIPVLIADTLLHCL